MSSLANKQEELERIRNYDESGRFDHVSLRYDELDASDLINKAKSPKAGAVSTFFGTTRDTFEEKVVTHLEYEAYPDMALDAMLTICDKVREKWSVENIVMQHKLGDCPVGQVSVAIVISSAHRKESLQALPYAIDELKAIVPIWKKEMYQDDSGAWKSNSEQRVV